ncbi:ribosome maturation factor RimP [Vulgatibacter sp.]|uniref:ribosome maturation factor RimP n=1 Tax=Vulgatibacter sp. TaxID=1971226 RepID=UPI003562C398
MSTAFVQGITDKVRELAEPLASHGGMELVDVEFLREGGRWVLRLYLDRPGGVSLDDCQEISRQVEKLLDVEDFIEPAYALEVSSPGLERPLKTRAHFEQFAGRDIELKTFGPIGDPPRKNYKGRLLGISSDDVVRIEIDGTEYAVPLDKVAKAHLAIDFDALAADLRERK